MQPENLNMDEITEKRRDALAASIRVASFNELKALGEELFPAFDHPWRAVYFDFINENSNETFHHATTHDRIHILYCGAKDKGIWFLPGTGKGPLQAKGLGIMKELAATAP